MTLNKRTNRTQCRYSLQLRNVIRPVPPRKRKKRKTWTSEKHKSLYQPHGLVIGLVNLMNFQLCLKSLHIRHRRLQLSHVRLYFWTQMMHHYGTLNGRSRHHNPSIFHSISRCNNKTVAPSQIGVRDSGGHLIMTTMQASRYLRRNRSILGCVIRL